MGVSSVSTHILLPKPIIHFDLSRDLEREKRKLETMLVMIKELLADAERKKWGMSRFPHRLLQEVICDADDLLDEFALLSRKEKRPVKEALKLFSWNSTQCKLEEISRRLDDIAEYRRKWDFQLLSGDGVHKFTPHSNTSGLIPFHGYVDSREAEKQSLVHWLVDTDTEIVNWEGSGNWSTNLSVFSIFGLGGIGKTALAQSLFNNPYVRQHFDRIMWVCSSDVFDITGITREMIEFFSGSKGIFQDPHSYGSLTLLQETLHNMLMGHRFLLVLDDVSGVDYSVWNRFLAPLKGGEKGCKILVTTRSKKIAEMVMIGGQQQLHLGVLSDEGTWTITKRLAFGRLCDNEKLEEVGKQVVEKLGGLPLAAEIIGRLLHANLSLEYWRSVLMMGPWEVLLQEGSLVHLQSSYEHLLTPKSKECFAYCSLFPRGHRFYKDELLQLWMAQGFISSVDEGEGHLDKLLSFSLLENYTEETEGMFALSEEQSAYRDKDVEMEKKGSHGKKGPYGMHVLAHHLALSAAEGSCVTVDDGFKVPGNFVARIPENVRHMSWQLSVDEQHGLAALCKYEKLRTLLFLNQTGGGSQCVFNFDSFLSKHVFWKLKRLRALGLRHSPVRNLPASIYKLKHLRYLDLSFTHVEELPRTVGDLWNLQVLHLESCSKLRKLPKNIGKLANLSYLNLGQCFNVDSLPGETSKLAELRYLDLSGTGVEELPESLLNLHNLQVLEMKHCPLKSLPEGIGNLANLRRLDLQQTDIKVLPKSLVKLHKLQVLNLEQCDSLMKIPKVIRQLANQMSLLADEALLSSNKDSDDVIRKEATETGIQEKSRVGSEEIELVSIPRPSGPLATTAHFSEAHVSSFDASNKDLTRHKFDITGKEEGEDNLELAKTKEVDVIKRQSEKNPHEIVDILSEEQEMVQEGARALSRKREEWNMQTSEEFGCHEAGIQEAGTSLSHVRDEITAEILNSGSTGQEGFNGASHSERHHSREQHEQNIDEGIASQTHMKDKQKFQEDKLICEREESVVIEVGIELKDSAVQTYLTTEFAHRHCFRPLILEEPQISVKSLVNVEGVTETVYTVERHLKNVEVDMINIQGVDGLGKTTLLKVLRNILIERGHGFKKVVMVATSKHFQQNMRMQRDIGKQLELSLFPCGPSLLQDKQAKILCQALSDNMPFLLLLDGAREVQWNKIGIPLPNKQNGCKIIVATDVRNDIENEKSVKVSSLDEKESKKLFLEKANLRIDDRQIEDNLVNQVIKKCNGIPLALITVGRAMARNKNEPEWQDAAINNLADWANDHQSDEQCVFSAIKFIYDKLIDDRMRLCFLYCCLYPEYHSIGVERLIQYWFGEGLLHEDDIDRARIKGREIVGELKAVSLLEDGIDTENEVKMHDVVRDVALQLTGKVHGQSNIFMVLAGSESQVAPKGKEWKNATRVSLMFSNQDTFPKKIPKCSKLCTLLINDNICLKQIPENLFKKMPALRVLDLSATGIKMLPKAVGCLSMLQFLNLSRTFIISLPEELGNLLELKQLDLSYMSGLSHIPQKAILRLSKLQALNLYHTTHWCAQKLGHGKQNGACVQDLQNLGQLKDLRLTIRTMSSLQQLKSQPELLRSTRLLSLDQIEDLTADLTSDMFKMLDNLQVLQITEVSDLKELIFAGQLQSLGFLLLEHLSQATFSVMPSSGQLPLQMLHHLHIIGCHGFKDLAWACQLPFLECIELQICYGIKVLTTDDDRVKEEFTCSFPMLKKMLLFDLPMLETMSTPSPSLPSLEYLEVFHCPKLKKLPLTAGASNKMKEIHGHKEWWDNLEWSSEGDKMNFVRLFKDPRYWTPQSATRLLELDTGTEKAIIPETRAATSVQSSQSATIFHP